MRALRPKESRSAFYPDITDAAWGVCVSDIIAESPRKLTIICLDSIGACESFYGRLEYFLRFAGINARVKFLPESGGESASAAFDALCERTGTLNAIVSCAKAETSDMLAVICTPESIFEPAGSPSGSRFIELRVGQKIKFDELKALLSEYGYYNETVCETVGQFAVRGEIIDVYPIAAAAPCRIDFFGDEIESIRNFDPDTQLTDAKIERIRIDAVAEGSADSGYTAYDYIAMSPSANWIFLEPDSLCSKYFEYFSAPENLCAPLKSFARAFSRGEDFFWGISSLQLRGSVFEDIPQGSPGYIASPFDYRQGSAETDIGFERFNIERESRIELLKKISGLSSGGAQIAIGCDSSADEKSVRRIFSDEKLKCDFTAVGGGFGAGFLLSDLPRDSRWTPFRRGARRALFASCSQLFGRRTKINLSPRRRVHSRKAQVDQLLDFSELSEGDYVVHLGHGICRYHGVQKLPTDSGGTREALKLEFEDGATLFLPLHSAHLISRYIGLDKRHPKLSKLDSKGWAKTKSAAELATLDYAAELLEMESKREVSEGFAFAPDDDWQREFDDSFQYVETPDQIRAINEIKSDMESNRPMERLLCADVGFGKTEVAMRAAFKAAMSGKQTAVLCPTTILAQQHFRTFRERMAGYPIVIEMLSRFRTAGESAEIRRQLEQGKIDILIGTHAILSDKVHFSDLGLLVIDEEHRFGVRHKEKIKKLKSSVDVLSMSATPIPRTLYFAMMGAKKISLMETPPKNRFPVETTVREYSDEAVRRAVETEISRGGQVFYLHNRVKTIDARAEALRAMFPNLRIAVGHGRMDEARLEKLMAEFVDGKFDILVCTTIIESGLDIPNCNTIIIEGADRFGLAQLYQLRGRVGRFTRRAYAWLFLHRHAALVESARKRLGAIRQYNKPGAGFRIATRDLQLRGCGNLLGAKQSGHIAGVGFDLYCALLKRSISLLKGEDASKVIYSKVAPDFVELGDSDKMRTDVSQAENYYQEIRMREAAAGSTKTLRAFISSEYIPQAQLRIDTYRKIAMTDSEKELDRLEAETSDRFGKIPAEALTCFKLARIRILAQLSGIVSVETEGDVLKLRLYGAGTNYFRINGHFPRLTKRDSLAKLSEIENFLRNVLPSLRK